MSTTHASFKSSSRLAPSSGVNDSAGAQNAPSEGVLLYRVMERYTAMLISSSGRLPPGMTRFRIGAPVASRRTRDSACPAFRWFGAVSDAPPKRWARKADTLFLEHRDGMPTGYASVRAVKPDRLFTAGIHLPRVEIRNFTFVQGMVFSLASSRDGNGRSVTLKRHNFD